MDLRHFYSEIAIVEAEIEGKDAVVVSLETSDGGKPGAVTEVPRAVAARMVVEKRARLATEEEAEWYRLEAAEAHRRSLETQLAQRVQVTVVSENELQTLKQSLRPARN